ncbi:hypothetical protein [Anaerofustis butyriciformans]|uniref:hypothetical protein n=1 Tax=Anaerofustis butyriciformans TaxID=3108533 RepID=UPI002E37F7C2|nr:hypothetical protein [Anaerofustis sp. HA2171]
MKERQNKNSIFKIFSVIFFVVAIFDAIMGIYSFISTVSSYTSQGFEMGEVLKYLFPAQFLPYVIEPLCTIGGIGFVLLGVYRILENNSQTVKIEETEEQNSEGNIVYESVVEEETVEEVDTSDKKEDSEVSENIEEQEESKEDVVEEEEAVDKVDEQEDVVENNEESTEDSESTDEEVTEEKDEESKEDNE